MSIIGIISFYINTDNISAAEYEINTLYNISGTAGNQYHNIKPLERDLSEPITINQININNNVSNFSGFHGIIELYNGSNMVYTTTFGGDSENIINIPTTTINKIKVSRSNVGTLTINADFNMLTLKPKEIPTISNLSKTINNNEIEFNYEIPEIENFSHIELYQDDLLLVDNIKTSTFKITKLEFDTNYKFTFYVVDEYGNKSKPISQQISIPENPNLIPSGNIFNLTHSVTDTTVNFKYNLPTDDRFSHINIYRNNELISEQYNLSEFTDRNLEPETEYEYRFVSVNKESILSNGYSLTIKTAEENDEIPPAVPTGLNAKGMNSGIMLSWNANTESDLQGYYIYINGNKVIQSAISNNYYNLTNLENDKEYSIQISAVDTFNNESEKSTLKTAVPNAEELPIFQLDTNLSSIALSVENWFSEIWLLVAFAVAIPLSFLIGSRIKSLFIA